MQAFSEAAEGIRTLDLLFMASRTCCADSRGISLQTGRVFGTDAQIGFPGIYREFTGVWVVNG
jgi:hypothetical protein